MMVFGQGGHARRGMIIAGMFPKTVECSFVISSGYDPATDCIIERGYHALPSRITPTDNIILTLFRTIILVIHALFLLMVTRPAAVVSTGPGIALPFLIIAGRIGIRTVYIESPSRVITPSITGLFLIKRVDLWFGSWSSYMVDRYDGVDYVGMVI